MYIIYSENPEVNQSITESVFSSQDDFGAFCPTNWRDIAEALKHETGRRCDAFIAAHGVDALMDRKGPVVEFDEIVREVWEDYCDEKLDESIPGFPKTIY